MVIDDIRRIGAYYPLDESLKWISSASADDIPVFHSFSVDREHTVVFTVERGSLLASTGWRETPEAMEATAAVRVMPGSFALYLPGEPFLVKAETEDTEATMRIVGMENGS